MGMGGKRAGAGRPKGISTKILERQASAGVMCQELGGDALWCWAKDEAVKAKDFRTVIEILKYWTDKRDGKAPQAITLNQKEPIQIIYKRDPETPAVITADKPQV